MNGNVTALVNLIPAKARAVLYLAVLTLAVFLLVTHGVYDNIGRPDPLWLLGLDGGMKPLAGLGGLVAVSNVAVNSGQPKPTSADADKLKPADPVDEDGQAEPDESHQPQRAAENTTEDYTPTGLEPPAGFDDGTSDSESGEEPAPGS